MNALELLRTPLDATFHNFADSISTDCLICSPYITLAPVRMLVEAIADKQHRADIQINVLTDISYPVLVQGATETPALLYLFDNHPKVRITYLPKLHAKVYIANRSQAIVASANFTNGGVRTNLEYGVRISDTNVVREIHNDISGYQALGADVNRQQIEGIHEQVIIIKEAIRDEQSSIAKTMQLHSVGLRQEMEVNLIRARVRNENINSILSKTLLYLLDRGPATTKELHTQVKSIHPDLCDDSVEHIIDGVGYGKKWKHQVRNAQVTLKNGKKISLGLDKKWRKTSI